LKVVEPEPELLLPPQAATTTTTAATMTDHRIGLRTIDVTILSSWERPHPVPGKRAFAWELCGRS
jgi:hypothetical protein